MREMHYQCWLQISFSKSILVFLDLRYSDVHLTKCNQQKTVGTPSYAKNIMLVFLSLLFCVSLELLALSCGM